MASLPHQLIHKETLVGLDIDLFANIPVEILDNMVKYFKTNKSALDFDRCFLNILVKYIIKNIKKALIDTL